MSEAREKLRMDCLRGRILGAEDVQDMVDPEVVTDLQVPAIPQEWQRSWRQLKGQKSKGRVKGLSSLFERSDKHDTSEEIKTPEMQHSIDTSESSVDSESEAESVSSQADYTTNWEETSPLDTAHVRESSDLVSPLPSPASINLSPSIDHFQEAAYDTTTVGPSLLLTLPESKTSAVNLKEGRNSEGNKLLDIFACAEEASAGMDGMTSMSSRNGTMVLVKKHQLAECVLCYQCLTRLTSSVD